jgi:leader peptidase (prepilin peptidase)/N-methyltransferase
MAFGLLLKFIVVAILMYIAIVDYGHRMIPDKCNVAIACIGVVNIVYDYRDVVTYLVSALAVFVFFLILAMLTDGGIGGGDIKLFGALGLVFGEDIILVLFFTYAAAMAISVIGLLFKRLRFSSSVAMGPFVAFGVLVQVVNLIFI